MHCVQCPSRCGQAHESSQPPAQPDPYLPGLDQADCLAGGDSAGCAAKPYLERRDGYPAPVLGEDRQNSARSGFVEDVWFFRGSHGRHHA